MTFSPRSRELKHTLGISADFPGLAALDAFGEASDDLVDAVLEEAGRLARDVWAPLNRAGDETGARLENGVVRMPGGFGDAYRQYVEGGWNGLAAPAEWGGQGLPFALAIAVQENFTTANLALSLCPMLNQGALEALEHHASEELKQRYFPKMISGEWTGSMCLTEPQAGSDVGALKTRAEPGPDGTWRIKGQKIYITYGEHDMSENIVHLVLARTPDSAPGTKGISMFLVPKMLPDREGRPTKPNDLKCVSLEKKLGIHASPTCVLQFGDNDGCLGWLLGEEEQGMANMFTMMNHARINVGLQGVAIAERAWQQAAAFAQERQQGRAPGAEGNGPHAIVEHGDVRRMLMTMRGLTEAARAIVYRNAGAVDRAKHGKSEDERRAAQAEADLLTPVSKAFSTDVGVEVASLGIQVHGGMGYVEETGAAQHLRDARITPIYEGTNGIQAMDLVGRKIRRDNGAALMALIAGMEDGLAGAGGGPLGAGGKDLSQALSLFRETGEAMARLAADDMREAGTVAVPFLRMMALAVGGYLLFRQAIAAEKALDDGAGDEDFYAMKIATARFFLAHILPDIQGLARTIAGGSAGLFSIKPTDFTL